jgi:CPA2 family monovalent cation:H+ antiporter-2
MINTARELNPNTETVVRTHNEEEAKLLERERARRIFLGQRKFATRAGARRTGCQ